MALESVKVCGQARRALSLFLGVFVVFMLFLEASQTQAASGVCFRLRHFEDGTVTSSLSVNQQDVLRSRILGAAFNKWLLRTLTGVSRKDFKNILLHRQCVSNELLRSGEVFCASECAPQTLCGEYVVPDKHLVCRRCTRVTGCSSCQQCDIDPANSGEGESDVDYLLYVTAVNSSVCQSSPAVFTSIHCEREGTYDRPIAGSINVCPGAFSSSLADYEYQSGLFLRELIGLLGFHKDHYSYFRDSNGNPQTPRNGNGEPVFQTLPGQDSKEVASTTTILMSNTPWITAGQTQNIPTSQLDHLIVTHAVRQQARDQFGCDSLTGMPLEAAGANSLSFWNKRVMLGELMTSDPQLGAVISAVTLALLEDTGWYQVNYSQAGHLAWGYKLGCTFANGSCLAYALENAAIVKREQSMVAENWTPVVNVRQLQWGSTSEFNQAVSDGSGTPVVSGLFPFSSAVNSVQGYTRCTYNHRFMGRSNLNRHDSALASEFLYFTGTRNMSGSTSDWRQYGGTDQTMSFCPYYQPIALPVAATTHHRFHDCKDPSVAPGATSFLEQHGLDAFCVNFASPWIRDNYSIVSTDVDHVSSGCYILHCNPSNQSLSIEVAGTMYNCPHSGAVVNVHAVVSGTQFRGHLICPSYSIVCGFRAGCPYNCRNRGTCRITDKGDQECVCNFGFSGAACSEIFGYGPYVPADSDVNPTVMTPTPTSDKQSGGVEWTGIVITNYVATFVATLVIIFLLVWLFKCGGMQHGKMKGPPSRAQQREQRRAAQLVAQTPQTSTIMEPSETRFATHPPAFRVRPEGSTPLYAVQATVGSYSFTPVADNGSVTVHESAA